MIAVLAGIGIIVELLGFGWAGWSVRSAWKAANPDERFWFPGRRKTIFTADGAAVLDVSTSGKSEVVLPDEYDTEQRIAWLVDRVRELRTHAENERERLDAEFRQQRERNDQRLNELGSNIANAVAQYRRDTIINLRDTGRGILLAVLGLALQVPAIF